VVALWHTYRVPILITTFTILIIFRTILHIRVPRPKISGTPPISPHLQAERKKLLAVDNNAPVEKGPRRIVGGLKKKSLEVKRTGDQNIQVLVFFSSLTGTTEKTAQAFTQGLVESTKAIAQSTSTVFLEPELLDLSYIDYDEYFVNTPNRDLKADYFYLILVPSYNIDTVLDNFLEHLQETHNDFRIDTAPLSALLGYAVFGFGDRQGWPTEAEGFCSQASEVDKWMAKLTSKKRAFPLGMGDRSTDAPERLAEWKEGIEDVLDNIARTGDLGEGVVGSGDAVESDLDDGDEDDEVLLRSRKLLNGN
jgi:tRNA wybutosine-synthesizing protein 1